MARLRSSSLLNHSTATTIIHMVSMTMTTAHMIAPDSRWSDKGSGPNGRTDCANVE